MELEKIKGRIESLKNKAEADFSMLFKAERQGGTRV